MTPAWTIDTWEEAEQLLPAEGPPFWLEIAERVLAGRRAMREGRNAGLEKWFNRPDPLYDRVRLD